MVFQRHILMSKGYQYDEDKTGFVYLRFRLLLCF